MIQYIERFCCQLYSPFDQHTLRTGVSDILAVYGKDSIIRTTQFVCCFIKQKKYKQIWLLINNVIIKAKSQLNEYGFCIIRPSQQQLQSFNLCFGLNQVEYIYGNQKIACELYLIKEIDKLVISINWFIGDIDGTLTKSDIMGAISNYFDIDHIHNDYPQMLSLIQKQGYFIIWMSMRSIQLYHYTKDYLNKYIPVKGPILLERSQFSQSVKKQIFKESANTKAILTQQIRQLFPKFNPFVAGLGNRQNDAIGYMYGGMKEGQVYLINTEGVVEQLGNKKKISYKQIQKNIQNYFPKLEKQKVRQQNEQINLLQKFQ